MTRQQRPPSHHQLSKRPPTHLPPRQGTSLPPQTHQLKAGSSQQRHLPLRAVSPLPPPVTRMPPPPKIKKEPRPNRNPRPTPPSTTAKTRVSQPDPILPRV